MDALENEPELNNLYKGIMQGGYHSINIGGVMIAGNVEKLKQLILLVQSGEDDNNE